MNHLQSPFPLIYHGPCGMTNCRTKGWTAGQRPRKMEVEVGWGRQSYKLPGLYCSCDSCEFFVFVAILCSSLCGRRKHTIIIYNPHSFRNHRIETKCSSPPKTKHTQLHQKSPSQENTSQTKKQTNNSTKTTTGVWSLRNSFGQIVSRFLRFLLPAPQITLSSQTCKKIKLLRTTTPPLPTHQTHRTTAEPAPLSLLLCLWQEVLCHLSQDLCPCLLEVEDFGLPGQAGVHHGGGGFPSLETKYAQDFEMPLYRQLTFVHVHGKQ